MARTNRESMIWAALGLLCMLVAFVDLCSPGTFFSQLADSTFVMCAGIFLWGVAWRRAGGTMFRQPPSRFRRSHSR